jgi:triosephosphate isomerase
MKKVFIVANWKMNPVTFKEAKSLFASVNQGIKKTKGSEVIICPPFVYLDFLKKNQKVKNGRIKLGAQNCSWQEKGAFTGEISPVMLKKIGCEYVILGHFERRKYFSETDETINKKIKLVLKNGLKPILCINKISQIKKNLKGISKKEIEKILVAYEPAWAIGTGKACGYIQAKKFNLLIKKVLGEKHPTLYGGSINAQNALGYIQESEFSGLLIGGISLKPKEFIKTVEFFSK